jgi:Uma2 family endonuclease
MTIEQWGNLEGDWELWAGKAYEMAGGSPEHALVSGELHWEIRNYFRKKKGIMVVYDHDIHLDGNTVLRPDIMVLHTNYTIERKRFCGVPDLVVEVISPSTAIRDMREKYDIYEKFGVKEYWIVDPIGKWLNVYVSENLCFRSDTFLEWAGGESQYAVSNTYPELKIDLDSVFGDIFHFTHYLRK